MTATDAKLTVIKMGKKLLHTGLTIRTWGNVSVRIDNDNFAITPSGCGYENLKPDNIVLLNINTPDLFGSVRPSSERLLHAEIYKKKSSIRFIIHTHQKFASAAAGCLNSIPVKDNKAKKLLKNFIPCAEYAPSGSKELAFNVAECLGNEGAVLMPYHGAVCVGETLKEAFLRAQTLENICRNFIFSELPEFAEFYTNFPNDYKEKHLDNSFPISKRSDTIKPLIYQKIYDSYPEINFIEPSGLPASAYLLTKTNVKNFIDKEKLIPAFLEDFAQIAGENIFSISYKDMGKNTAKYLQNRNALLIENKTLLCCVSDYDDMIALKEICEKNFTAFFLSKKFKTYSPLEANYVKELRKGYINDYSKRGM
ncbi:class II aldolase/adducin family protein [Treponema pedis]|uniref:class II aldolase/adducin family protein n=1 Tax=Treponema pedis TaxID=409322 RepID=UPI000413A164|nr:class II aldolase/adducin family protein [Treponema pedis]